MSVLSGSVDSFGLFYFCRFGLGVFQSFFNPTSYSIISDVFHKDYRTTANSVFNLGIYFGGGLASMSQALINAIGWRQTYDISGYVGYAMALLVLIFIREPERNRFDKQSVEEKKLIP